MSYQTQSFILPVIKNCRKFRHVKLEKYSENILFAILNTDKKEKKNVYIQL